MTSFDDLFRSGDMALSGSATPTHAIRRRPPAVAPAVVLMGYAYARKHHPDIDCLNEVDLLYERICVALVRDPVLRRMVERNPDYAALLEAQRGPERTSGPLSDSGVDAIAPSDLLAMVGSDPEFRMVFAEWNARFFLVVGPLLREMFHREDFDRFVRSLLHTLLGPEHLPEIVVVIRAVLDDYITEEYLADIKEAVNWVLTHALRRDLPDWTHGVLDWLLKRTLTLERLPRLRSTLDWLLLELVDPEALPAHIEFAADWFVKAARKVAEEFQEGVEDEELGVADAAQWLGISPWTLRTHIRKRRGTPSEVPVRLVRGDGARGRGRHVIKRSELFAWARDHWFSEKKKDLPPA